jgi:Protein of unknown function DUF262
MSILQNVDVNLKEMVDDISKGRFLIPKFQRDFVWKKSDIESLGDSIIRGYPISSMLMMPANGSLSVSASPLKTEGARDGGESQLYVLDGQQRLTSIAKLFLAMDDAKEYYFDMLSILCDAFPGDKIKEMHCIKQRLLAKTYSRISNDLLCRSFDKRKDDETTTRQDFRFIMGSDIIYNKYSVKVNKFLSSLFADMQEQLIEKYTNHLNGVFGDISGFGIPVTKINANANLGVVVRVFEKVNTSGKKLTLFDLINAKSFETRTEKYQIGLADYMLNSVNELNQHDFNIKAIDRFMEAKTVNGKKSYDNLARFVRAYYVSDSLKRNITPSIQSGELLGKDANFWFDGWDQSSKEMFMFLGWLENEELLDGANLVFIEYMCGVVMNNPGVLNEVRWLNEVKKYALYLNLAKINFNKSNMDEVEMFAKFGKDIINAHGLGKHSVSMPEGIYNLNFESANIIGWEQGRPSFKAAIHILYCEKAGGKFSFDLANGAIKKKFGLDEHHIFPKAQTRGDVDPIYNSVANFVLLNPMTNRHEIGSKHPGEYLKEIEKSYPNDYDKIISHNLLEDFDAVAFGDAEAARVVLHKRLNAIADLVKNYFK